MLTIHETENTARYIPHYCEKMIQIKLRIFVLKAESKPVEANFLYKINSDIFKDKLSV